MTRDRDRPDSRQGNGQSDRKALLAVTESPRAVADRGFPCYDKVMMVEPVPHVRPLSFAMELRVLINRHRRVNRELARLKEVYRDVERNDDEP